MIKTTNYLWSVHFAMATMTTVGYGDVSPTNTAELVYCEALLWLSLLVFSACLGILMNLINDIYREGQERRNRLAELGKYMSWRVLPRDIRRCLRRYLNFVWYCAENIGEVEDKLLDKLSPTLRSKLSVHIFGAVLFKCPFLAWMHDDQEAMKKLCLRVKSEFLEANDILFSFGEMNTAVYVLVRGWAQLCMGARFADDEDRGDAHAAVDLSERNRASLKASHKTHKNPLRRESVSIAHRSIESFEED